MGAGAAVLGFITAKGVRADMITRAKALLAILVVVLLIATSVSVVLLTSDAQLSKDSTASSTKLQMNTILDKGRTAVEEEIGMVRNLTYDLALQLRATGLNGTMARDEINHTLALNPFAIDILTFDTNGIVQAVEPAQYSYLEGVDLSGGNKTAELLLYKVPTMSNTFQSRGIERGSGYACPVFDNEGKFIGAVSTLYNVSALMNATLPQLVAGTGFTYWCMQSDGVEIYDADASQIGMNIIYGPDYQAFPQVQAIGWRMVNESTGFGTYSYFISLSSQTTVDKECYWTSLGAEGIAWRLAIVHIMEN